jgi:hypothetical protein
MRHTWWLVAGILAFALMASLNAQEKAKDKEVTLKGKVTCANCELKIADQCQTVVVVKEEVVKDGKKESKDVVYYFAKEAHEKYIPDVCAEGKQGTVTAAVSEKDGKKWLTVSKVEYAK